MASKHPASSSASEPKTKRPRKSLSLDVKLEIVRRHEGGEGPSAIARSLGIPQPTVSSVIKAAPQVKKAGENTSSLMAKMITKQREPIMVEMERLLKIYVDDQTLRCIPLSATVVSNKALSIIEDLKEKGWTMKQGTVFNATRGWFERFKHRAGLNKTPVSIEDHVHPDPEYTVNKDLVHPEPDCTGSEDLMQLTPGCTNNEDLVKLEPECTIKEEEEEIQVKPECGLDLKTLQEVFSRAKKMMKIIKERDPDPARSEHWAREFEKCMNVYKEIYDSQKKVAKRTATSSLLKPSTSPAAATSTSTVSTTIHPSTLGDSDTHENSPNHEMQLINNSISLSISDYHEK